MACPGCGALVPESDGPAHRYIGASPGCWAVYGEVLAREYEDVRYGRVHRLTVDAYAAQHPGVPSPQSVQSVAVHLLALHAIFERGVPLPQAKQVLQEAVKRKREFRWLDPPGFLGEVTVLDVHAATDPEQHEVRVHQWARAVWQAWAEHHHTIRSWAAP
jgi:hypothetical protein